MNTIQEKLDFFRQLIRSAHDIYMWIYDEELRLISSNCHCESVYNEVFRTFHQERLMSSIHSRENPVILTSSMGLVWLADFEKISSGVTRLHLIGPLFIDDMDIRRVQQEIDHLDIPVPIKIEFMQSVYRIPVLPATRLREYSLMLHYCLTGKRLAISDLTYDGHSEKKQFAKSEIIDQHGTYLAERAMQKLIKMGDLNYRSEMDRLSVMGRSGVMSAGDPVRQAKNQVIVFTAISARSAIQGGLSPEVAYTLSDIYIQQTEAAVNIAEIAVISRSMTDDFVRRVHQIRSNSNVSRKIQSCCNYISLHPGDPVNIRQLAEQTGYSEYYLSKKFKREVGMSVRDYVYSTKVERAKDLLVAGTDHVNMVSEMLGFGSPSYFCEVFREFTGMTPGEYRSGRINRTEDP